MDRRLITIRCGGRNRIYDDVSDEFKKEFLEYYDNHTAKETYTKYKISKSTFFRMLRRFRDE